jgi:hypothetical protein
MNCFHKIESSFKNNSTAHIFHIPSHSAPSNNFHFEPIKPIQTHITPPTIIKPFVPFVPPLQMIPEPHIIQPQPEHIIEQQKPTPPIESNHIVENKQAPAIQSTFSTNPTESDTSYILYGLAGLGLIIYIFNKK